MSARRRRPPAHELRRAGLTRDRVLGTAVQLADDEGLDGLSMRKLAKRLGVEAMSLYNHIPGGRERLLDGMVDLVFEEIDVPSADGPWRDELRNCAVSTRAALRRHQWAVGLMEARPNPGESNRRLHEAALVCLLSAGFSVEAAIHRGNSSRTPTSMATRCRNGRSPSTPANSGGRSRSVNLASRPRCATFTPPPLRFCTHIAKRGFSHDEEFLFGLDLILDGLEQRLPRRQRSPRSRSRSQQEGVAITSSVVAIRNRSVSSRLDHGRRWWPRRNQRSSHPSPTGGAMDYHRPLSAAESRRMSLTTGTTWLIHVRHVDPRAVAVSTSARRPGWLRSRLHRPRQPHLPGVLLGAPC